MTMKSHGAPNSYVRRAVDLDELMREAARAAAVLGRQRGVKVTAEVPAEAPYEGDEDLLRRMVLNLLENAVAHTPEGGGVRLELSRRDGGYVVTVADSGTGIPADEQPRVFDRFHRVEGASARTAKHPGTGAGLGLAIARWVAEAHQGRLELVRSDETGTTFTATLP
jgi:two-component system OmpR family sensor kinase